MVGGEEGENFVDCFTIFCGFAGEVFGFVKVFFETSIEDAVVSCGPGFSVPCDGVIGGIKETNFVSE